MDLPVVGSGHLDDPRHDGDVGRLLAGFPVGLVLVTDMSRHPAQIGRLGDDLQLQRAMSLSL